MFGNFHSFVNVTSKVKVDPKDIPPPTPVNLPRFQPFAHDDDPLEPEKALATLLKLTSRSPAAMGPLGFQALGLDLKLDATLYDLIPEASCIPEFDAWDKLSLDDARDKNQATRRRLRNGNLSPGCQVYLERNKELSNPNEEAYRTVRRLPPLKGKQQARLGNAYEFFRCLEALTTFWDDPTLPPALPPSPEALPTDDPVATATQGSTQDSKPDDDKQDGRIEQTRTSTGSSMPQDYRNNLVAAFIKLVSYDFGCNVSPSRVEPRLHLSSVEGHRSTRKTYYPSACSFIFQSPLTREAARAGMVYGPVAAVSARGTTDFTNPDMETAQGQDLARETIAALITAQHRAREGQTEKRFGDGQWWTTKKRWGGGTGGPIGREIDRDAIQGDKDARPTGDAADGLAAPAPKKARKTMSIYDNYRMVRAPSSTWDRKTHYEAIGKQSGADYDDIFVVSSLFHHISILRFRVPGRLLDVLSGAHDPDRTKRSWGKVEAWRSPWYDLFDAEQRLAALKILWGMMAYQMRSQTEDGNEDVKMANV